MFGCLRGKAVPAGAAVNGNGGFQRAAGGGGLPGRLKEFNTSEWKLLTCTKGVETDVRVWEINVSGSLPEDGVGGGKRKARA